MNLAELIVSETQQPPEQIMFLRHRNNDIAMLQQYGATVEEYTSIQPPHSRYDYIHPNRPHISVVVVIVNDRVYGVFQVAGLEAEGTNYDLGTEAYRAFETNKGPEVQCCRFQLIPIASISIGLPIIGWNAPIQAVLRHGGNMFATIQIRLSEDESLQDIESALSEQINKSILDTSESRLMRLALARKIPQRTTVTTNVFNRNADVIAEVLFRAEGVCQACMNPAPFTRRSNGSPYLEVHHITPLAEDGEDAIDNAIALCPNCHRKAHYA